MFGERPPCPWLGVGVYDGSKSERREKLRRDVLLQILECPQHADVDLLGDRAALDIRDIHADSKPLSVLSVDRAKKFTLGTGAMHYFIKLTAIIAVALIAIVLLAVVLKIVIVAAVIAGVVVGGVFLYNLVRRKAGATALPRSPSRF